MKAPFNTYRPACAAEFVKHFEGYEAEPYFCSAGKKTIGFGHVIQEDENLEYVSMAEATELLAKDLNKHAEKLAPFVKADCTKGQYIALLSMAFNVGVTAVKNSTLLRLFNAGREDEAAKEFPKWVYANGKVIEGLKRRRAAEQQLFMAEDE